MRFYWDFCHKYHHEAFDGGSLSLFLRKLQEKKQSEQQQNQAKQAVSLFYEMQSGSMQPLTKNKSISSQSQNDIDRKNVHSNNWLHHDGNTSEAHDPVAQHPRSRQPCVNPITVNNPPEKVGISWVFVFDQLVSEIKIRHYSPKTLKAYRGWMRAPLNGLQNILFAILLPAIYYRRIMISARFRNCWGIAM